jgi:glycosyltransferase involved in cell wall biosynthesis
VWNIRQTLDLRREKPTTRWVIRAGAGLSRSPRRILYVSSLAREQHQAVGYCARLGAVVPNGFDLKAFRRDPSQRARVRGELGIREGTCLIGHLARYHPMKDQLGLIGAARRVIAEGGDVVFVLAGAGLRGNAGLSAAIRESRLEGTVRLCDETASPESLLSACDLFCLPSAWGEGFPNAVGEAMACELPCVVTRVGAAPEIVGDTGLVVAAGDRDALAQALLRLIRLGQAGRTQLGSLARERIAQHFALARVAACYADHFQEALGAA